MSESAKGPSGTRNAKTRATTPGGEPGKTNKSRLAALAPGENIKEKQV